MKDGAGFNRFDAAIGHKLALVSMTREYTDGEVYLGKQLARKYRRQLSPDVYAVLFPGTKDAE